MVVRSFFLAVFFYQRYEFLNTQVIASFCIFTPVASCLFTHEIHRHNGFYNFILNHCKSLSLFLPRCPCNLFKFLFELFKSAFVIQLSFKFCQIRNGTAVSLHLIEDFHKDFYNSLFTRTNLCRTFGINIKEHDIRRNVSGIGHFGNEHRIFNLLAIRKVFNGSFPLYHTVFQQVRQNL